MNLKIACKVCTRQRNTDNTYRQRTPYNSDKIASQS